MTPLHSYKTRLSCPREPYTKLGQREYGLEELAKRYRWIRRVNAVFKDELAVAQARIDMLQRGVP